VSNATVRYSVLARDYSFTYDGPATGPRRPQLRPLRAGILRAVREVIDEGEGRTDAQGRFLIEIEADLGDANGSQLYTIEAQVTDRATSLSRRARRSSSTRGWSTSACSR